MNAERISLVILALLMVAGSFWDGLYSPTQHLLAVAVLAVLWLLVSGPLPLSRLEMAANGLLAAALLLSLRAPAATGTAAHGPLVVAGWLLALAVGRRMAGSQDPARTLPSTPDLTLPSTPDLTLYRTLARTWAVAGTLMAFGGLAAISYLPVHHSHRLASFLGYPVAVGILGLMGSVGSLPVHRPWLRAILVHGNVMALLLSGSRGVWAVALLVAAYLCWARRPLLRGTVLPFLGALTAALWVGPAVASFGETGGGQPMSQAIGLLLPALLTGLTALLPTAFQARRRVGWLATTGLAAAAAWGPGWGWLLGRAAALTLSEGSAVERLTFIRDGLRMVAGLPLGAGYRAWSSLHLQGASYGYYSAEAHSALVAIGLSFGWLGLAAYVLLLIRFFTQLRQGPEMDTEKVAVLAALGALALHSMVDWDLSYAVFSVPLWLGFGLAGGGPPGRPGAARAAGRSSIAATLLAALLLPAVALVGAGDLFTAAAEAALSAGSVDRAKQHGAMAVALTPWNDQARAALGRALAAGGERQGALAQFARARTLGPREPWYAELQARELAGAGRWREAAQAYADYTRLWPWQVPAYESALDAVMDLTIRAELQGDEALARDLMQTGREILARLDRQKALEPPGIPRQPLGVGTESIRQARQFFKG